MSHSKMKTTGASPVQDGESMADIGRRQVMEERRQLVGVPESELEHVKKLLMTDPSRKGLVECEYLFDEDVEKAILERVTSIVHLLLGRNGQAVVKRAAVATELIKTFTGEIQASAEVHSVALIELEKSSDGLVSYLRDKRMAIAAECRAIREELSDTMKSFKEIFSSESLDHLSKLALVMTECKDAFGKDGLDKLATFLLLAMESRGGKDDG